MNKLLQPIAALTPILWLAGLSVATGAAQAQETSPAIAITLIASKASYLEKEPIKLEIRAANISDADVITRKGFFNQAFHLKLTFIDPDGEVVRFFSLAGGAEGGPPLCVRGQCSQGAGPRSDYGPAHRCHDRLPPLERALRPGAGRRQCGTIRRARR